MTKERSYLTLTRASYVAPAGPHTPPLHKAFVGERVGLFRISQLLLISTQPLIHSCVILIISVDSVLFVCNMAVWQREAAWSAPPPVFCLLILFLLFSSSSRLLANLLSSSISVPLTPSSLLRYLSPSLRASLSFIHLCLFVSPTVTYRSISLSPFPPRLHFYLLKRARSSPTVSSSANLIWPDSTRLFCPPPGMSHPSFPHPFPLSVLIPPCLSSWIWHHIQCLFPFLFCLSTLPARLPILTLRPSTCSSIMSPADVERWTCWGSGGLLSRSTDTSLCRCWAVRCRTVVFSSSLMLMSAPFCADAQRPPVAKQKKKTQKRRRQGGGDEKRK